MSKDVWSWHAQNILLFLLSQKFIVCICLQNELKLYLSFYLNILFSRVHMWNKNFFKSSQNVDTVVFIANGFWFTLSNWNQNNLYFILFWGHLQWFDDDAKS